MRVLFISSHPIQYLSPLYKHLFEHGIDIEVWYGSDASIKGLKDLEFGQGVKWDINLLDGYPHRFFKNYRKQEKAPTSFWELWNPGMLLAIMREPKSIIVFSGWQFFMHLLLAILAAFKGHQLYLRMEMPWRQEALKQGWKQIVKQNLVKLYFKLFKGFLYIGQQNKLYYLNMGIKEEQLHFAPYCVDNKRFSSFWQSHQQNRLSLRQQLRIPDTARIILYSGKLISKKRPLDLLHAFHAINQQNAYLLFMGDGELRESIEKFTVTHNLSQNVRITGFINQLDIPVYYSIADIFVMCSEIGETWGLSVNEAMNFSLPIVVSDLTGCSDDLVEDGVNGFVFETGNLDELANCLKKLIFNPQLSVNMGSVSESKIHNYSYDIIQKTMMSMI